LSHILTLSALGPVRPAQRPKLTFVDSTAQFVRNKTRSPRGWTNWPSDFSPVDNLAKVGIKLPPIEAEVRAGNGFFVESESLPLLHKEKFKARGF
jgi:hypothetical protein